MDTSLDYLPGFDKRPHYPDFKLTVKEYLTGAVEITARKLDVMKMLRAADDYWIVGIGKPKTEEEFELRKLENLARAQRRACLMVREKIMQIGADHLLTLTYRENMDDSDRLDADFTRFIRLMRKTYPDWQYVATPEFQHRGAFHMHIACVGKQDINFIRKCWYTALGSPDSSGIDTPGQVDIQYRRKRFSGISAIFTYFQLANYLSKYISKTFDHQRELGKRRYKSSHAIPRVKTEKHYMNACWISDGDNTIPNVVREMTDLAYFIGLDDYQLWSSRGCDVIKLVGVYP